MPADPPVTAPPTNQGHPRDTAAAPWLLDDGTGNRARRRRPNPVATTPAAHPENCVDDVSEPHIQNGECMCECSACTSSDGQSCICPDCDPARCIDRG